MSADSNRILYYRKINSSAAPLKCYTALDIE